MLQITEDTPPDMLAGAMDLTVHLPTGRSVRMAVERSTPMMDLLVQITTNHHLQLSNHTLQALGMAPSAEHSDRVLPYKPNTPIGALDTQHIKVIPKTRTLPAPKNVAPGHQPFESTFRLKVHLPRNQLYVTRVSRNVLLEDIMKKVCEEKNLDPIKYEFKHPGNLDEVLDPKLTLSDYQITEIYVVAKGTISLNQAFSTSDIMALRKEEERKQMHNKTGGGVFNLIFRRGKSSMGSGSLSSENRSISPTHSDDSRSVTPPAVQPAIIVPPPKLEPTQDRPKPPQRKRRPAPKPPQTSSAPDHEARKSCSDNDKPPSNISVTEQSNEELQRKIVDSNGLTICHSRNSSDSSGYHEASILSDNCNTSLPRRPKSAYINGEVDNKLGKLSRSTTNLTQMAPQSKSTSSLAFTGRKKKAAPPPPPALKSSNSVASLAAPSPIVASQPPAPQPEIQESITSGITQNSHQDIKSNLNENKEPVCVEPPIKSNIVEKVVNHTEEPIVNSDLNESAPKIKSEDTIDAAKAQTAQKDLDLNELDWQYQLPSPPKAFRDSSPAIFTDTQTITDFKDSVVTSPELFEKLKAIEDHQSVSDLPSVVSEEDKAVFNKLSLEHLEKRKSLVYNRELATSLKMTDLESKDNKPETFTSSLTKFEATYNEVRRNSLQREEQPVTLRKSHSTVSNKTSTLPNFKITTYDNPKQKIKVFEDDTIRSNTDSSRGFKSFVETHHSSTTLSKTYIGTSMENIAYRKNSLGNQSDDDKKQTQGYSFYKPPSIPKSYVTNSGVSRSESFSTDKHWSPTKPVSRSKSHLTLNKYGIESNLQKDSEDSLTKSSSLFDVSGLQSLGVMKLIQNKLNTPTSSMENIHKPEPKPVEHIAKPVDTYKQTVTPKLYQYSGPPSINMSTWSERPKVPVSVKEDADYKLSSKLIVTTTDNFTTRNNRVEVKNNNTSSTKISSSVPSYSNNVKVNGNYVEQPLESKNVSVKINGTEPISTQHTGNVVIKIGNVSNPTPKIMDNQRFINHTTATGYRKPFSDINSSQPKQRPHSIALDSSFDISRVPVVRSVELKKPYKDFQGNNTSITQIYQTPNNFRSSTLHRNSLHEADMDNFPHMYKSIETLTNTVNNSEAKTVGRVNSYKAAPVVRGFKPNNEGVTNNNNKVLWNKPNSYSTLPSKPKASKDFIYSINKDVPFSQSNLRRTDSNKIGNGDKNDIETSNNERNNYNSLPPQVIEAIAPPPPPPQMPKIVNRRVPRHIEPVVDPREQLLSAIRNFGGKKGLKTAKA